MVGSSLCRIFTSTYEASLTASATTGATPQSYGRQLSNSIIPQIQGFFIAGFGPPIGGPNYMGTFA